METYKVDASPLAVARAKSWALVLPEGSEVVGELLRSGDAIPEPLLRFNTGLYGTWLGGSLRTCDQGEVRRALRASDRRTAVDVA